MKTGMLLLVMAAFVFGIMHVAAAAPEAAGAAATAPPAAADQQGVKGQQKWMDQLTADQRAQVQAKIKEMTAAGKSKDEIRTAVMALLKGWGIKVRGQGTRGARGRGGAGQGVMAKLTDEQRKQLQDKMAEMGAAGKTPEEIRAAVQEMLKGWGIEPPQAGGQTGRRALMAKLTPDQRQQVQAKIKEMRAAGKTREEIGAAVMEMLKGWGVQPPAQ